ncbi:MAG TPA: glucose 1-dehydrogenase [Candidatus Dormibacteraeota bacterium]|jgi:NAD(P)-dependent dehydrogenase (short-subunit alcohol dehydrogenase family)|nr:glucose 1-dehydrogenase [Candidatus Dormibacteraeota bacterium]
MKVTEHVRAADRGRLAGKVAIVTGAGSGIGSAIVRRFRQEGASVVAVDLRPEGLGHHLEDHGVFPLVGDVTSSRDVAAMVGAAGERFGGVDILCNNAGILDRLLPVAEMTDDVWRRVLEVNLTGPMMLCRAAIPAMLRGSGGAIVNIASVGGLLGSRGGAAYTASKHGLIGLTRNIAATYGREGLRCNAICPGAVETGISLGGEPSPRGYRTLERALAANIRTGDPNEIAAVAAFLASDDASFVNGAVVVVDGAWTAH